MTAQSSPAVALEVELRARFWKLFDAAQAICVRDQDTPENWAALITAVGEIPEKARRAAPRTPAETGEGRVPFGVVNSLCGELATSGDIAGAKVIGDLWQAYQAALAALPPSSGWEAGAEAMREQCVAHHLEAAAFWFGRKGMAPTVEDEQPAEAARSVHLLSVTAIKAMPLPPPPSKETVEPSSGCVFRDLNVQPPSKEGA